jgi:hypothetical protein
MQGNNDAPAIPIRKNRGYNSPKESSEVASKENTVSTNGKPPLPKNSNPLATPPQVFRKIQRRNSIGSNAERRADFPLTPPRRVSAPLDVFLAQCSLRNAELLKSPGADEIERKPEESPDLNNKRKGSKKKVLPVKIPAAVTSPELSVGDSSTVLTPLERHKMSISETWTKINLPQRVRSVSAEANDSSHRSSSSRRKGKKHGHRSVSPQKHRLKEGCPSHTNDEVGHKEDSRQSSSSTSSPRTLLTKVQWMREKNTKYQRPPRIKSNVSSSDKQQHSMDESGA